MHTVLEQIEPARGSAVFDGECFAYAETGVEAENGA